MNKLMLYMEIEQMNEENIPASPQMSKQLKIYRTTVYKYFRNIF